MAQKVLFITQEMTPYVADSAMSAIGYRLPLQYTAAGHEVRTFMPKWGCINERRNQLHEVIRLSGMNIGINETDHVLILKVASIPSAHMQVYFIDNNDYFKGRLLRTDKDGNEYADNIDRAIFYARGVLETVKKLRWQPDIVVCEGWMSYFIPFYIRTAYREEPTFNKCKIVSTYFRDQLTSDIPEHFKQALMFREANEERLNDAQIDFTQKDAALRLSIHYSDAMVGIGAPAEIASLIEATGRPFLKVKSIDTLKDELDKLFVKISK